jgi:hypothetical protein
MKILLKLVCLPSFFLIFHLLFCNIIQAQDSTVYLNNKTYSLRENIWYVTDQETSELFKIDTRSITVKLNEGIQYSSLETLCNSANIEIIRSNILGYIDLLLPQNAHFITSYNYLQNSELFSYAEMNSIGKILGDGENKYTNDPGYSSQYFLYPDPPLYYRNINAEGAWWIYTEPINTPQPTVVAVIDVGVDGQHLDLNLTTNGYDFYDIDPIPQPLLNDHHGTGVAGIIGARTNNGNGVAGVAGGWNNQYATQIMPLRVGRISQDPNEWEIFASHVDDAIIYAADNGARIINMSFKLESNQQAVIAAIEYAYKVKGCFLVAASGNDGSPPVYFPANNPYVMAVGGINKIGGIGGSYGPELEVVAPSVDIYSTINSTQQDRYRWGHYDGGQLGNGTSASSPMVAGVAALLLAYIPELIPLDLKNVIIHSATDEGAAGFDIYYGYGLVNAYQATENIYFHTPPQNLTLQVVETHAQLTWETVDGVGFYNIYRSSSSTGRYDFEVIATVADNGLATQCWTDWSYHIFPGGGESIRYYRISSLFGNKESYTSDEVNVNYGGFGGGEQDKISSDIPVSERIDYSLSDCYPNPFNPVTNIKYSIKEKDQTTLKVYNFLGEEITVLVNKENEPGEYIVSFNAEKLPSGIYIYTLISGSYIESKKMILLK